MLNRVKSLILLCPMSVNLSISGPVLTLCRPRAAIGRRPAWNDPCRRRLTAFGATGDMRWFSKFWNLKIHRNSINIHGLSCICMAKIEMLWFPPFWDTLNVFRHPWLLMISSLIGSLMNSCMFEHIRPNPDVAPHLQSSWSSSSSPPHHHIMIIIT